MKNALIIFVKNLIEGKVKTRLAATIGDNAALKVYCQLLLHTQYCAEHVAAEKTIFYSDYADMDDIWDATRYAKQTQAGNDLGKRMFNAFEFAFDQGKEKVVIIGSDCYELNSEMIEQGFQELKHYDIVIGPALDGGYYLLGMNSLHRELFNNIAWSTGKVLHQTLEKCVKLGLKVFLLQELSDIDNEEDLKHSGISY